MTFPPDSPIFLIGYRGTGKSTVARELAAMLEFEWVDSDDVIQFVANESIADIFENRGEEWFRNFEEAIVSELTERRSAVVSLGGGAVLREGTRKALAIAGPVIWLKASPDVLAKRLSADSRSQELRPSLTGQGLVEEIEQVLAERTPIYQACATLTIDTNDKLPLTVAEEIRAGLAGQ